MIAILTTFLGLMSGLLPALLRIWERSKEFKHEQELLKLRLEALGRGIEANAVVSEGRSIVQEGADVRNHDLSLVGNSRIEALRAAIRPTITIAFFALFCFVKVYAAFVMINEGADGIKILHAIWGSEELAIFGGIMGFWFGSRSIYRFEEQQIKKNSVPK